MSILYLASPLAGDGKSMVAAGLAGALRADGLSVQLVRLRGGEGASADAAAFTLVRGIRSGGVPADLGDTDDADVTIAEAPNIAALATIRRLHPGHVVLVTRPGQADDLTLSQTVDDLVPVGLVLNSVNPQPSDSVANELSSPGVEVLGRIPQDRLLSAPSVQAMAAAVDGRLSGAREWYAEAVTWLQIGPISAHSGIEHFSRYPDKAVVTRNDKIDVALAALDSEPACLILSGGEPTLPYVAQRAESEDFALITTSLSTPEVVTRIGELYANTSFSGRRKVQRAAALASEHLDLATIRRALGV